jgi:hypothetical protein
VAWDGLTAAVVGSPLAPRLAPPDFIGFATFTCSHKGNLEVVRWRTRLDVLEASASVPCSRIKKRGNCGKAPLVPCGEGGASVIAVVIPAFDEADRLRVLLPRIPARLFGVPVQIIVVSDGCTDGTDAVAVDHGAVLVRLPRHRGKGAALRAGFARAMELDPSQLVTMDADGQHDPADLERLVQPVIAGECALAAGSRFLSDSSRGPAPLNRYLVRKVLVAALRAVLGRTYTDPCCGYRCFSFQALQVIRLQGDHYQSELETLFEAAGHGLSVVEVPVRRDYPPGCSKMGAQFGRLAGRAWVISQYVSTIASKTWQLRRVHPIASPTAGLPVPGRTG